MADLVLFPGMDGTGLLFDHFIEALAAYRLQARVMSYPKDRPTSLEMLAASSWKELADDPPPIILGESFGGQVALRLLRDHPESFRAQFFVRPSAKHPDPFCLAWQNASHLSGPSTFPRRDGF